MTNITTTWKVQQTPWCLPFNLNQHTKRKTIQFLLHLPTERCLTLIAICLLVSHPLRKAPQTGWYCAPPWGLKTVLSVKCQYVIHHHPPRCMLHYIPGARLCCTSCKIFMPSLQLTLNCLWLCLGYSFGNMFLTRGTSVDTDRDEHLNFLGQSNWSIVPWTNFWFLFFAPFRICDMIILDRNKSFFLQTKAKTPAPVFWNQAQKVDRSAGRDLVSFAAKSFVHADLGLLVTPQIQWLQ